MPGKTFVGCSGWQYASWSGTFYPRELPASRWLPFYAQRFVTVEVNNTFYRLPEATTFAAWREATPPGFVITVKASRYLTHLKRLKQPGPPLARLFSRAFALGPRLGPILYQLPATLKYDETRLRRFLRALDTQGRRALARKPTRLRPGVERLQHVIEFRDPSWYRDDVFEALGQARVAVCLHDMPGSTIDRAPSTDLVYVRYHGTTGKYRGSYTNAVLKRWAGYLTDMRASGRDVYAYFNNDLGGTAVRNAKTLLRFMTDDCARPTSRTNRGV